MQTENPKISIAEFRDSESRTFRHYDEGWQRDNAIVGITNVLTLLSILGEVKIRKINKFYKSSLTPYENFEVFVNDQSFFTFNTYYGYTGGIFGKQLWFVITTKFMWSNPMLDLEQIIRLYINLKTLLNTDDFRISIYNDNDKFMDNHYMVMIGEKKMYVEHRYAYNIEKRLQRDCPYYLK